MKNIFTIDRIHSPWRSALLVLLATGFWFMNPTVGLAQVGLPGQQLENGTFETGDLSGWTGTGIGTGGCATDWNVSSTGGTSATGCYPLAGPVEGTYAAYTSFEGPGPLVYNIQQVINLPDTFCSVTLSFWHTSHFNLSGAGATEDRTFRIEILDSATGTSLDTLYQDDFIAGNPAETNSWRLTSLEVIAQLLPYRGTSIIFSISAIVPQNYSGVAGFGLDDVSLYVEDCDLNLNTCVNDTCTYVAYAEGLPGYTFFWDFGDGFTSTASSVSHAYSTAGTYTIMLIVTDESTLCADTSYQTITVGEVVVNITASTLECFGDTDGVLTAVVTSGSPDFHYEWSTGAPGDTLFNLSNVGTGTYSVTVTDDNGCRASDTIDVPEPPEIIIVLSPNNPSCAGELSGSVSSSVSGGTPPYTYAWSNGSISTAISGLVAGEYCLTITDANSCTKEACVTLTEPDSLIVVADTTNPLCADSCNGTITLHITGGTPPIEIEWDPSLSGNDTLKTGLCEGLYTVLISDANGCEQLLSFNLADPDEIVAAITDSTDVLCFGDSTGTATVTASGGTGALSYLWSYDGQTSATATGLPAGEHCVIVSDENGCAKTVCVTIGQPAEPIVVIVTESIHVYCHGDSTGSITVLASGGTGTYTYIWSPDVGSGATVSGLPAGEYCVTVEDANSCSVEVCVTIEQPSAPLIATITSSEAAPCNTNDEGDTTGTATVSVTGGTGTYTYLWDNGETTAVAIGLPPGPHCVTVTDENDCSDTACVTILQPDSMVVDVTTEATCANEDAGSATATVTGGTPGYTFLWVPTSPPQITATAVGLGTDTYTVTVTDSNGCSDSAEVNIVNHDDIPGGFMILCEPRP